MYTICTHTYKHRHMYVHTSTHIRTLSTGQFLIVVAWSKILPLQEQTMVAMAEPNHLLTRALVFYNQQRDNTQRDKMMILKVPYKFVQLTMPLDSINECESHLKIKQSHNWHPILRSAL